MLFLFIILIVTSTEFYDDIILNEKNKSEQR